MAKNADVAVGPVPVQITDSDVAGLRVKNCGTVPARLMATAGAVPPGSWGGALPLMPGESILPDQSLALLFPHVSGANRVYAVTDGQTAWLSVSHA